MAAGRPITSVLRKYGAQLLENGYSILPIPAGRKGPIEPQWQKIRADEKQIRKWANGNYKQGNIGFHTKHTPAVDIDITDDEMAAIASIDKGCRLIKGQVFLWKENQDWRDLWDEDGVIVQ